MLRKDDTVFIKQIDTDTWDTIVHDGVQNASKKYWTNHGLSVEF